MASADKKLSLGEKLGYALGDAAANFVLQMRLAFLTHFYTDVYGIATTTVAVIQAVSHVIDACNDLVMGALSDRTQTRWGKFRPWMFWTAVPLGLASFLVFAAPDLSANGKIVYAYVTLIAMIIFYGANNIPYSALGGVISDDPDERVNVASWRFYFAMGTALVVLTYTTDLVKWFGDGNALQGYRATMAIWSLLAIFCSFTAFFATRERVATSVVKNGSLRDDIKILLRNPAWPALAVAAFIVYICLGLRGSMMLYYFVHVLDREPLFGYFNATGMIGAIVGIFFSTSLSERFGKRNVFCGGLIISSILAGAFFPVAGEQTELILGLQFVFQVAFGATMPLLWGMIADVADLTEWQTGRRITALTFAATLFFFKIGQGIGMALTPSLLQMVGYQPNTVQSPETVDGMRLIISFLPAALFFLSGVTILWYVITHAMEREMTAALRERRETLDTTAE